MVALRLIGVVVILTLGGQVWVSADEKLPDERR